ncbi:MAG: ERCC4 domain-containing protein [Candidatus Pacearchaeota archaeon]
MTFHNIFSGKKLKQYEEKNSKKPEIIIDKHEKNSLVPSILCKLNMNIEFKDLKVADYIINNIAIERKTIPDFKSSIINKRLLYQIKDLCQYPKSLIILEGITNFSLYEGFIHENAFRGFILSVLLEHKIPIVFTEDEEDTAKYLAVLAKKTEKSNVSLRQKVHLSEEEQKQFILEGFPGIGPATARSLLKEFKSIKKIINAKPEQLNKLLGKKTDKFIKILST